MFSVVVERISCVGFDVNVSGFAVWSLDELDEIGSGNGAIRPPVFTTVKLHFRSMAEPKYVVGRQAGRPRYQQGLTQEMFAARRMILGLELSRATLSRIDSELGCVTDKEFRILAAALKVEITALFPANRRRAWKV
jgi:hypothetical protein